MARDTRTHVQVRGAQEAFSTAVNGEYPCIKVQGLEFDELKVLNISIEELYRNNERLPVNVTVTIRRVRQDLP